MSRIRKNLRAASLLVVVYVFAEAHEQGVSHTVLVCAGIAITLLAFAYWRNRLREKQEHQASFEVPITRTRVNGKTEGGKQS